MRCGQWPEGHEAELCLGQVGVVEDEAAHRPLAELCPDVGQGNLRGVPVAVGLRGEERKLLPVGGHRLQLQRDLHHAGGQGSGGEAQPDQLQEEGRLPGRCGGAQPVAYSMSTSPRST